MDRREYIFLGASSKGCQLRPFSLNVRTLSKTYLHFFLFQQTFSSFSDDACFPDECPREIPENHYWHSGRIQEFERYIASQHLEAMLRRQELMALLALKQEIAEFIGDLKVCKYHFAAS
jgi:hypothetical protein